MEPAPAHEVEESEVARADFLAFYDAQYDRNLPVLQ
ncbi:MAG: hypothetical protein ACI9OJ_001558 [Myxococcota bacterium]|jgi:hypothetical protein